MDIFVWSTIILAIWAALGPLVGVRYGEVLSRRAQRDQWLRENRKQEYREAIGAISGSLAPILQNFHLGAAKSAASLQAAGDAEHHIYETLGNRIFIAEDLEKAGTRDKWSSLKERFSKDNDSKAFAKGCVDLIKELRVEALKFEA